MMIYKNVSEVPVLNHSFPLAIKSLHQIELTSLCSLRCVYCPSPDIVKGKYPNRPAMDMTETHFRRALEHVGHYAGQGTQSIVNFAGIGESMMREDFIPLMEIARERLPHVQFVLATNGLHMTDERATSMARLRVGCWVSLHRPEKAGPAVEIAKRHGIFLGTSNDPATNADDWAGQVKWFRSQLYVSPCIWLREGKAMVLADGRVTTCCLDATGAGVVGHVDDQVGSLAVKPYALCTTCAQEVAVEHYDQRRQH